VVGAEAGDRRHLLEVPAAGLRVAREQIPVLVGLAGQLRLGLERIGVVVGINDVLAVIVGATGFEPSQHRCLAAVIPPRVSSARTSFCARRSDDTDARNVVQKLLDAASSGPLVSAW
jgi:hypothetical protein